MMRTLKRLGWRLIVAAVAAGAAAAAPAPQRAPKKSATQETPGLIDRMLAGPMKHVDAIVFAVRVSGRDHWYANFSNYASDHPEPVERAFKFEDGVHWAYGEGARLCRMNLRTREVTVLLDDPRGGIRDPCVHYDTKRILFAYRRGGSHTYHLAEIDAGGGTPRMLTDGPDDDFEPSYLPDGRIVFVSGRGRRFVNCWHSRVGNIYLCDGDGSNIRPLSPSLEHDNTPWPLPDGRVLYQRWEYVDRSQLTYHHLWTMNPDGTQQMTFFGNMNPGNLMIDAKPIDGAPGIVAIFSPGHGRSEHRGRLTLVDPRHGPDRLDSAVTVSPRIDVRDPWAFGTNCFLVADDEGITIMDGTGAREVIYRLPPELASANPAVHCHEPRPLIPRAREAVVADRADLAKATGEFYLRDVATGRNMEGVKPGEIRKLLILEQLPKPVNFSGGMEPLTIGGSFSLARILGTVPVEPDGSARFEAPALRPLFFVALDEHDMSVKRMQSWCTVQPGEIAGCVGCHEPRTETAPSDGVKRAMLRPASRIEPVAGVPDVLDFPRDIQPVLDRHCSTCHNPETYAGKLNLIGANTPRYTVSYEAITRRGLVADGRNLPQSNYPPRALGASASKLYTIAASDHHGVKLSPGELMRIRLWIESSATYPGTYAALQDHTSIVSFHPPMSAMKRCAECHLKDGKDKKNQPVKQWNLSPFTALVNLDDPERSILLRAPLAKSAGGLGRCGDKGFASAEEPDYQAILKAIVASREALLAKPKFDMPGFRPNRHYIREMQRFGILPENLTDPTPVDPYATDQAYWESFWWTPPGETK